MATVVFGCPLITTMAKAFGPVKEPYDKIVLCFDGLVYVFLPQLNMLLLRLIQGRPLIHRLTGRSLTIGDVPWVNGIRGSHLRAELRPLPELFP